MKQIEFWYIVCFVRTFVCLIPLIGGNDSLCRLISEEGLKILFKIKKAFPVTGKAFFRNRLFQLLNIEQPMICPLLPHQFLMRSHLDDSPVFHQDNPVGMRDGREAMGYDDRCPVPCQQAQRFLD